MLTRARVWSSALRNYWWFSIAAGLYFSLGFVIWGGTRSAIVSAALFSVLGAVGLYVQYRLVPKSRSTQIALVTCHLFIGHCILIWQKNHLPLSDYTALDFPATRDFLIYLVSTFIVGVMSMFGGWAAGAIGLIVHYGWIFNVHEEFSFKWIFPIGMVIAGDIVFTAASRLDDAYQKLEALAHRDPMTGLLNRNRLDTEYERLKTEAEKCQVSLLLVAWDLDGLKQVNDVQGHAAGDAFIRKFATTLRVNVRRASPERQGDAAFRVGGDEFISMHLNVESGEILLERVHRAFPAVTGGWVLCNSLTLDQALTQADRALYANKQNRKEAQLV